jgi:hypothetical protein
MHRAFLKRMFIVKNMRISKDIGDLNYVDIDYNYYGLSKLSLVIGLRIQLCM